MAAVRRALAPVRRDGRRVPAGFPIPSADVAGPGGHGAVPPRGGGDDHPPARHPGVGVGPRRGGGRRRPRLRRCRGCGEGRGRRLERPRVLRGHDRPGGRRGAERLLRASRRAGCTAGPAQRAPPARRGHRARHRHHGVPLERRHGADPDPRGVRAGGLAGDRCDAVRAGVHVHRGCRIARAARQQPREPAGARRAGAGAATVPGGCGTCRHRVRRADRTGAGPALLALGAASAAGEGSGTSRSRRPQGVGGARRRRHCLRRRGIARRPPGDRGVRRVRAAPCARGVRARPSPLPPAGRGELADPRVRVRDGRAGGGPGTARRRVAGGRVRPRLGGRVGSRSPASRRASSLRRAPTS